jgi:hypothetical protein
MPLVFTITKGSEEVSGNTRNTYGTLAFDATYPTGGESFTARQVGLSTLKNFFAYPSAGYVFEWDRTASKLKAFQGDNPNAAAAPMVEVVPGSLAALTAVKWEASGS